MPIVESSLPSVADWLAEEKNNRMLDSIEKIISILGVPLALCAALLRLFQWLRKTENPIDTNHFLKPVTEQRLRQRWFPEFNRERSHWVDRGATATSLVLNCKQLLLRGPSGIGKTREAVELIASMSGNEFPANAIFELNKNAVIDSAKADKQQFLNLLQKEFDSSQYPHLCVLVDDLPHHYPNQELLEHIQTMSDWLGQQCKYFYLVLTARDDHIQPVHEQWFTSMALQAVCLETLKQEQGLQLLQAGMASIPALSGVDEALINAFMDEYQGRPQQITIGLRLWQSEIGQLQSAKAVRELSHRARQHGWNDIWKNLQQNNPDLPLTELRRALCLFYHANITSYAPLVDLLGMTLWQQRQPRWYLRNRLNTLHKTALTIGLSIEDDVYQFDDAAVETACDQNNVERVFDPFLLNRNHFFRWLLSWYGGFKVLSEALYQRGLSLAVSGQYAEGNHFLTNVIRLNPEDYTAYYNRGVAYQALQGYEEALADYTTSIRLNQEFAIAYNNRGLIYQKLQRYSDALTDYDTAIRLNPEYARAYYNRGLTYEVLQLYQEELTDYDTAIRLNPEFAKAYYNRGNIYNSLQRYEEAVDDYATAIRLNPEDAYAYYNRGNTYKVLRRYEEALADYTAVIRLSPELAMPYGARGHLFLIQNKADLAISDIEKGLSFNQYSPAVTAFTLCLLAQAYDLKGDQQSACTALSKALAIQSEHENALVLWEQLGCESKESG